MPPDAAILEVGRTKAGGKHEQMQVLLLSRSSDSWLRKLPWTVKLQRDLQQKRHLQHPLPLLQHCQDRGQRQRDTCVTSSSRNQGATFWDAIKCASSRNVPGTIAAPTHVQGPETFGHTKTSREKRGARARA